MTRFTFGLCWIILIVAMATGMFIIKNEVIALEKELAEVNAQIVTDQKELHVLKAEWTHLNDPNRIRQLGERYAHLKPVRAEQIISFSSIPFKSASSSGVSESGIIRVSYSTSANGN